MSDEHTCAILLASGSISQELVADLGNITQATLPVRGRPLVLELSQRLLTRHEHLYITMDLRDPQCNGIASTLSGFKISVMHIDCDASLFTAFYQALRQAANDNFPSAEIMFSDTYSEVVLDRDSIVVAEVPDWDRWTVVHRDSKRGLVFADKGEALATTDFFTSRKAVVGHFKITNIDQFLRLLESERGRNSSSLWNVWSEYDTTVHYTTKLVISADWKDFGHLDTFHASRMDLLGTRNFNSLSTDSTTGFVRKSSLDAEKLDRELEWFESIPPHLQHIAPRIQRRSGDADGTYAVEYQPVVSCGEALTMGNLDDGYWSGVRRSLEVTLARLHDLRLKAPIPALARRLNNELVVVKYQKRLDAIRKDSLLSAFLKSTTKVNDRDFGALDPILDELGECLAAHYSSSDWTMIHGDLFFGNILFDRRTSKVVLIDPRGRTGGAPIGGDALYDFAKLSQSIRGTYDFYAADLFSIRTSNSTVCVDTICNESAATTLERLDLWFAELLESQNIDSHLLTLLEASLLVSATPLHPESGSRQMALLSRGIERFRSLS